MLKYIASYFLIILVILTSFPANARPKRKKRLHSQVSARIYKMSRHRRKSRRFRHGTGPDLKAMTTDSPYKEDPSNGVNPIETKQL